MFIRTICTIFAPEIIKDLIMALITISSYDEFAAYLGKELGQSDWLEISQERINMFADATLDHQWIHVDTERANIAHGYLTLSLLPYLYQQVIEARNIKMLVNYGMDKMKFGIPVLVGKRVRLSCMLYNIANLRGTAKVEIKFTLEIEGERKPALEGIATFLYMFEN